jgi:hypothetical protein
MDAACIVTENKEGPQTLIKQSAPETVWTPCMIHHESLVMEELCPELTKVMDTVMKTVNYIKTQPLNSRLFVKLCEEMRTQ